MSYRPEDWKNPYKEAAEEITKEDKKKGLNPKVYSESAMKVSAAAYEAGADAYEEALKENALIWRITGRGCLVFIPDGKEDK